MSKDVVTISDIHSWVDGRWHTLTSMIHKEQDNLKRVINNSVSYRPSVHKPLKDKIDSMIEERDLLEPLLQYYKTYFDLDE